MIIFLLSLLLLVIFITTSAYTSYLKEARMPKCNKVSVQGHTGFKSVSILWFFLVSIMIVLMSVLFMSGFIGLTYLLFLSFFVFFIFLMNALTILNGMSKKGVFLVICIFKFLVEVCLYSSFGVFIFSEGIGNSSVLNLFTNNSLKLAIQNNFIFISIFISVYSMIFPLGFWIFWGVEASYFSSFFIHSFGLVSMGSFFFYIFVSMGALNNVVVFYIFLVTSFFCFIFYMILFICSKGLKSSLGFFSASSSCFLFTFMLVDPKIGLMSFIFLSVIKISIFYIVANYKVISESGYLCLFFCILFFCSFVVFGFFFDSFGFSFIKGFFLSDKSIFSGSFLYLILLLELFCVFLFFLKVFDQVGYNKFSFNCFYFACLSYLVIYLSLLFLMVFVFGVSGHFSLVFFLVYFIFLFMNVFYYSSSVANFESGLSSYLEFSCQKVFENCEDSSIFFIFKFLQDSFFEAYSFFCFKVSNEKKGLDIGELKVFLFFVVISIVFAVSFCGGFSIGSGNGPETLVMEDLEPVLFPAMPEMPKMLEEMGVDQEEWLKVLKGLSLYTGEGGLTSEEAMEIFTNSVQKVLGGILNLDKMTFDSEVSDEVLTVSYKFFMSMVDVNSEFYMKSVSAEYISALSEEIMEEFLKVFWEFNDNYSGYFGADTLSYLYSEWYILFPYGISGFFHSCFHIFYHPLYKIILSNGVFKKNFHEAIFDVAYMSVMNSMEEDVQKCLKFSSLGVFSGIPMVSGVESEKWAWLSDFYHFFLVSLEFDQSLKTYKDYEAWSDGVMFVETSSKTFNDNFWEKANSKK